MMGILVMINNYFHDLSVAVLFVSVLGAVWVGNSARMATDEAKAALWKVSRRLRLVAWASLVLVLAFGYVRAAHYKEFEWNTAVAHGQIAALVIKHIFLVGLTGLGVWQLIRSAKMERR